MAAGFLSDPRLLGARDERGTSALRLAYSHRKAEVANALPTHRPDLAPRANAGGARPRPCRTSPCLASVLC